VLLVRCCLLLLLLLLCCEALWLLLLRCGLGRGDLVTQRVHSCLCHHLQPLLLLLLLHTLPLCCLLPHVGPPSCQLCALYEAPWLLHPEADLLLLLCAPVMAQAQTGRGWSEHSARSRQQPQQPWR
jgi:hypothetical protein